jgi:hypothetical protein
MARGYCLLFLGLMIGMKEETQVSGIMHRTMENTKKDTLAFKTMVVIFFLEMSKSKNFKSLKMKNN